MFHRERVRFNDIWVMEQRERDVGGGAGSQRGTVFCQSFKSKKAD